MEDKVVKKALRFIQKITVLTEIVDHYAPVMYNYRLLHKCYTEEDLAKTLDLRSVHNLSINPDEWYINKQCEGIKSSIAKFEEYLQENSIDEYPELKERVNEVISKANTSVDKFNSNIEFIKNDWFQNDESEDEG